MEITINVSWVLYIKCFKGTLYKIIQEIFENFTFVKLLIKLMVPRNIEPKYLRR